MQEHPSDAVSPRSRPARSGRTRFQRAQREESRQKIIDAAAKVFSELGYIAATVHDILSEADISRPTFYRYFGSKLAVALEHFDVTNRAGLPVWVRIGQEPVLTGPVVRAWIVDLMALYATHKPMLRVFTEMGAIEPSFPHRANEYVPSIMAALAETIPAFRCALAGTPQAERIRAEALLLLNQLLESCRIYALYTPQIDQQAVIDVLADHVLAFVEKYEKPARRTK